MRQLRELVRMLRRKLWGPPPRSLETCLILPQAKVVYAYVPKAACTSIKAWLLRYSGESPAVAEQFSQAERAGGKLPDAHRAMYTQFSLRNYSAQEIQHALTDPSYFKFTFVRHPLRRLVSSYIDKIVNARFIAHEIIAWGQQAKGCSHSAPGNLWRGPRLDTERSLSFREFVHALVAMDHESLEVHFRPQHRILRGLEFDFVGKVENLPADFAVVQRRFQADMPLTWRHQTDYTVPVTECVADWPAVRLRNVASPSWKAFYDEELQRICQELFAADFERFQYTPLISNPLAA